MKRILFALAFLIAAPLQAQTLEQLAAKVDTLSMVLGNYNKNIPCSQLEAERPPTWFGDGGYETRYRMKQIGCAIDNAVQMVGGFQAQISGLAARLAVVEQHPPAPGTSIGNIVSGDLIVRGGRLCIVPARMSACLPDISPLVQIAADGAAGIQYVSNLDGGQYQYPAAHWTLEELSSDGGKRDIQNAKATISTYTATDPTNGYTYQSGLRTFVDPTREFSMYGTDSRGQWCMIQQKPGQVREYTQDFCFRIYPDQKVVSMELWQSGWQLKFAESSGFITIDKWFRLPPQQ